MRSNCIAWALQAYVRHLAAWLRAGRPAGFEPHIVLRPSRVAPWWVCHWQVERWDGFGWIREGFGPVDKSRLRWWQMHRTIWFLGRVERTRR